MKSKGSTRMSQRAYAAHRGESRRAVQKAIRDGRITVDADGKIDASKADAEWEANTDPAKRRLAVESTPAASSFVQARAANELLKAQERKIRLQRLKGEVVDRVKARALVVDLFRQERDSWLSWPARVAPLIAAELGVASHRLHAALEKHVRDHLSALADPDPRFR